MGRGPSKSTLRPKGRTQSGAEGATHDTAWVRAPIVPGGRSLRVSVERERCPVAPRPTPVTAGPKGISGRCGSREEMRLVEARSEIEWAVAKTLIEEYVASLEIDLNFQGYRDEMVRFPGGYSPPDGAVLLAYEGTEPTGVVALRRHSPSVCEMKRLYVRPKFRGHGIGRALSVEVVRRAAQLGYTKMRLDTLPTMDAAIGLYHAIGFRDIPPYRYNPVAGARYLELDLRRTAPEAKLL